jgi:hypothetical protein
VKHGDDLDGVDGNFALYYSESEEDPVSSFEGFLDHNTTMMLALTP